MRKSSRIFSFLIIITFFFSFLVPTYINGLNQNEKNEFTELMRERELLIEEKNKELSEISSLMTPENVYNMAVYKDLDLTLVQHVKK